MAVGSPPSVSILDPQSGLRLFNDAPLNLSGQAFDDSFREVAPRGLTWTDGRRVVGRGRTASLTALAPGLHTIRLTARDRAGRSASASVLVRLLAARPRFTRLDVPQRAGVSARFVTLRVSTSLPASLRVGRSRIAVSATARAIRIPVRRGAGAITLTLRLTAYGQTSTRSVRIARR